MKHYYRWINVIGLIVMLVINFAAQRGSIGGQTTAEVSAKYPVLITPAGYTFMIWLLIYAFLIGFVTYSFTRKGKESKISETIGPYFLLSCLFNSSWIILWQFEKINSSVFMMLALLITLVVIYITTQKYIVSQKRKLNYWLVSVPFSLYLGWICVATIVNIAVALLANQWDGLGVSEIGWTIIMLVVATLLAVGIGFRNIDPIAVLVFVWAFIGIAVEQHATPAVANTPLVFAIFLFLIAIFLFTKKWRKTAIS
ncbi:tryptophan-rich sensory protein [Paenibacillus endoradicis]|uniref:tryptophan-rich sensory protein n=1 Tax=Paenibacillus endoradicis TaxID=2972487 RepID=UPI0021597720|nr:tryptophan-rich sensory protein [Paenibacillus endoradicis]MCR8660666.1 tryptophan-rich sensory protein [Paenibacillus endoradicis]